jgi:cell division protein FtsI (penicillin-binding protein 3)
MGRTAAQILGGTDVDEHGVAGVEKYFDQRLFSDSTPLRLSIDVRVQAVVRDELSKAIDFFQAIGGCGIVMDVNTGEVLALVSLPDYDANDFRTAPADDRFNRAVTGMYEPGSTFKLQTASMALDSGIVHIWDEFDASRPIQIGRFTITDFEGKHRWLYLPEVLAYSSNLGAAHIAETVGGERQRAWLKSMGMFNRIGIELPEAGLPIVQSAAAWKQVVTMTVAFGHGISVSPLHVVRGTAAVATGVLQRPTMLALPPGDQPEGVRVMQPATSDIMRKLMRLVVTDGFGKQAEVPGYYPGGKTGTAEKVGKHGYHRGFKENFNVAAFTSVFPMNAPRYAVYIMVDEPHGNKSTYGYSTAGWVAAPAVGRVIARAAPMLGMLPDIQDAPAINQALYIPLEPGRPAGAPRSPPIAAAPDAAGKAPVASAKPGLTVPATTLQPARPIVRDRRHEAALPPPSVIGAKVVPASAATPSLAAR